MDADRDGRVSLAEATRFRWSARADGHPTMTAASTREEVQAVRASVPAAIHGIWRPKEPGRKTRRLFSYQGRPAPGRVQQLRAGSTRSVRRRLARLRRCCGPRNWRRSVLAEEGLGADLQPSWARSVSRSRPPPRFRVPGSRSCGGEERAPAFEPAGEALQHRRGDVGNAGEDDDVCRS